MNIVDLLLGLAVVAAVWGIVAGIGTGSALQAPLLLTVAGVLSGFAASYLLVRRDGSANAP